MKKTIKTASSIRRYSRSSCLINNEIYKFVFRRGKAYLVPHDTIWWGNAKRTDYFLERFEIKEYPIEFEQVIVFSLDPWITDYDNWFDNPPKIGEPVVIYNVYSPSDKEFSTISKTLTEVDNDYVKKFIVPVDNYKLWKAYSSVIRRPSPVEILSY